MLGPRGRFESGQHRALALSASTAAVLSCAGAELARGAASNRWLGWYAFSVVVMLGRSGGLDTDKQDYYRRGWEIVLWISGSDGSRQTRVGRSVGQHFRDP